MERGTERERTAVRTRWADLEHQRALANQFATGLFLVITGALLFLIGIAVPYDVCIRGDGIAGAMCMIEHPPAPIRLLLLLISLPALVFGTRACLRPFRPFRP